MPTKLQNTNIETKDNMWLDWEVPKDLLHSFYFKYYKEKNDFCMSPFYTHEYTQTIWALKWYPNKGDNKSIIYLELINKPSNIKSITVSRTIQCKQLNLSLTQNDNEEHIFCYYNVNANDDKYHCDSSSVL